MRTLSRIALVVAGAVAIVWLVRTGSPGVAGPWLVALACPLLHLGMMAFMGHGCHGGHGEHERGRQEEEKAGGDSEPLRQGEV